MKFDYVIWILKEEKRKAGGTLKFLKSEDFLRQSQCGIRDKETEKYYRVRIDELKQAIKILTKGINNER